MPPEVRVIGVEGMPEIQPGDDLAGLLVDAAQRQDTPIEAGDVVVVTQKVVSKAEGRVVSLQGIEPSPLARTISTGHRRDPRHTELILQESERIVRMDRGMIISETRHGFICANAGIDASNIPGSDIVCLLPVDSDASARAVREAIKERLGIDVAVLVSDTFGRPWRKGATNVCIGIAGLAPLLSYVGLEDSHGNLMHTTVIAVADELAAAAELVAGKVNGVPVSLIRGYRYDPVDGASHHDLIRPPDKDLFR